MDKDNLFASLVRWNYWGDKPLPELKDREILRTIMKYEPDPLPVIITGVRRSGKSSLFSLIIQELFKSGINRNQILFLNFEEPQFSMDLSPLFLDELVALYRERVNPDKKIYFFLDEIQNLPDWQRWVRREADLKEHKVFVTGSSAKLLSGEIATLLTGRYITFQVFPLSFREILSWNNIQHSTEIEYTENRALIRNKLNEYFQWGGYPEVVLVESEERRKKILSQYLTDILYRDIVYRHQIRDVRLLEAIAHFYITNISSLHSYNRIRNLYNTSIDNIRRYSAFLEESFLVFFLKKFSFKLSNQQKTNRKVYAVDVGLRNQYGFRFSEDFGKLAENVVALTALRRADQVFYHTNQGECDFIIQQEQKFKPIQVCMDDLREEHIRSREMKGIISALRYLREHQGIILTDNHEGQEKIENLTISFVPLWKFLVEV